MGEKVLFDYDIITVEEPLYFGIENAKKFSEAEGETFKYGFSF